MWESCCGWTDGFPWLNKISLRLHATECWRMKFSVYFPFFTFRSCYTLSDHIVYNIGECQLIQHFSFSLFLFLVFIYLFFFSLHRLALSLCWLILFRLDCIWPIQNEANLLYNRTKTKSFHKVCKKKKEEREITRPNEVKLKAKWKLLHTTIEAYTHTYMNKYMEMLYYALQFYIF